MLEIYFNEILILDEVESSKIYKIKNFVAVKNCCKY